MNFLLYTFLAQAYSCDSYGGSAYGECAAAPTPSTDTSTSTSTSTYTSTSGAATSETPETTTTTDKKTGTTQQQTTTTQQPTTQVAEAQSTGWDFGIILLWAFIGALIIAIIMFLWRRWRRSQESSTLGGGPTIS